MCDLADELWVFEQVNDSALHIRHDKQTSFSILRTVPIDEKRYTGGTRTMLGSSKF